MNGNRFYLSSSPHFTLGNSTQKIMLTVIIALLPECIWGVLMFGMKALVSILVSVLSCVVFELLFQLCTKQKVVISNLSAVVTGIMLSLVCSPLVPWWLLVLGSAVSIIVAKGLFGGIGSNVFNPALTGRAFLFISFPALMGSKWLNPAFIPDFTSSGKFVNKTVEIANGAVDAFTSATPLSLISKSDFNFDLQTFFEYFFGFKSGCTGEISILLILISFLFLLVTKTIDWRAPFTFVSTVAVCSFVSGFVSSKNCMGAVNEMLLNLLTGGLFFGACFMVTDYATTPVTKPGRFLFGLGCGIITFLIRRFGGYPEGVMFSILIMNPIVPFLNNFTVRMYGYGKKAKKRPYEKKITQNFDLSTAKKREGI